MMKKVHRNLALSSAAAVVAVFAVSSGYLMVRQNEDPREPLVQATTSPTPIPSLTTDESKALEEIRSYMDLRFATPPVRNATSKNTEVLDQIFKNRSSRDLARLFARESQIKLAKNDFNGAMESCVDGYGLAVMTAQNGLLLDLYGAGALEELALYNVSAIIPSLNAEQCLILEKEIAHIQSYMPSLAMIFESEKQHQVTKFRKIYGTADWNNLLSPVPDPMFGSRTFGDESTRKLKAASKRQLESNIITLYDKLSARAVLSYPQAKKVAIKAADPYSHYVASTDISLNPNYIYARHMTEVNLCRAALIYRASMLDKGNLIDFKKRLPDDPFGDEPLKMNGPTIYSIGPDSIDNHGEVSTLNNKRDILAPAYRFRQN